MIYLKNIDRKTYINENTLNQNKKNNAHTHKTAKNNPIYTQNYQKLPYSLIEGDVL